MVGGDDYKDTTRRILRRAGSYSVWEKYNLDGRQTKKDAPPKTAFRKTKFYKVMKGKSSFMQALLLCRVSSTQTNNQIC